MHTPPGSSAAPAPNFRMNKPAVKAPTRVAQPTGDAGGWKERRAVVRSCGCTRHSHAMHMPYCTHATNTL